MNCKYRTGALLGLFIDGPILITTLDIAEHYDKESLERCINRRSVTGADIQFFHRPVPKYLFSKSHLVKEFPDVRSSDIAVYWAFNPKLGRLDEPVVTVNGHKQGAKKRVDDETPLNPKTMYNQQVLSMTLCLYIDVILVSKASSSSFKMLSKKLLNLTKRSQIILQL